MAISAVDAHDIDNRFSTSTSTFPDVADFSWKPLEGVAALRSASEQPGAFLVNRARRWVVERTLAWLNRNRRLAKDVEATIESAATWLYIASVKLMSRRLATA